MKGISTTKRNKCIKVQVKRALFQAKHHKQDSNPLFIEERFVGMIQLYAFTRKMINTFI